MKIQDIYMGLGSLVYAIARADGHLHPLENKVIRQLLEQEPFGDVARCAFTLREFHRETAEEAYAFALRHFRANRVFMDEARKADFVSIAESIARAHNDVSVNEQLLLERLRADFNAL
ncbi:TerB family tellurite resistance protein [Spirosoma utsteinense]|uniref:Tellurite resistance protein B-like protein n=2 Tax=Spirosoma utsteinense TaxID=2585773 RepID=A0ABR6W1E3_9BACT|nr:TerB family tellurite resistance protein [Spirosoma utsteinense]MBC3790419.1 putative tellurite resistance protein B-like protein [Spirosoma utsteinense]